MNSFQRSKVTKSTWTHSRGLLIFIKLKNANVGEAGVFCMYPVREMRSTHSSRAVAVFVLMSFRDGGDSQGQGVKSDKLRWC